MNTHDKKYIAKILLAVSVAITDIEIELLDLKDNKKIKSLKSDLCTLKNVKAIIESQLSDIFSERFELAPNILFKDFYAEYGILTLETHLRELSEEEITEIANFLGCDLYFISWDLECLHHFSNEVNYETAHFNRVEQGGLLND